MTTTKIACCWGVMGYEGKGGLLNCQEMRSSVQVRPGRRRVLSCLVLIRGWKDQHHHPQVMKSRRMNYLGWGIWPAGISATSKCLLFDMMDGSVLVGVTRYERSRASLS